MFAFSFASFKYFLSPVSKNLLSSGSIVLCAICSVDPDRA
nr:MAG TPA: hypothetical protein [Bacteriophage sp.]